MIVCATQERRPKLTRVNRHSNVFQRTAPTNKRGMHNMSNPPRPPNLSLAMNDVLLVCGREPVVLRHQRVPVDHGGEGDGHDPQAGPQRHEVRDGAAAQAHVQLDRAAELRRAEKGACVPRKTS